MQFTNAFSLSLCMFTTAFLLSVLHATQHAGVTINVCCIQLQCCLLNAGICIYKSAPPVCSTLSAHPTLALPLCMQNISGGSHT